MKRAHSAHSLRSEPFVDSSSRCHMTYTFTSCFLPSSHLMEGHIVPWGGDDRVPSPTLSARSTLSTRSTPSIMSVDTVLSLAYPDLDPDTPGGLGTPPGPYRRRELSPSLVSSGSGLNDSEPLRSPHSGEDGPFIRHHKYFFEDGNITFLVRGVHDCGDHTRFIDRGRMYYVGRWRALLCPSILLLSRVGILLDPISPTQRP
jgi:hypothetical protein